MIQALSCNDVNMMMYTFHFTNFTNIDEYLNSQRNDQWRRTVYG